MVGNFNRSDIYKKQKKVGANIEPCGTPDNTGFRVGSSEFNFTNCKFIGFSNNLDNTGSIEMGLK